MPFSKIDHVAVEVSDIERSAAFYAQTFGFERYAGNTTPGGMEIVYLRLGGTVLELVGRAAGSMGGFHFCLVCDDFDAAVERLRQAGVAVLTEPHPTAARVPEEAGWRRVVFAGPDGEQIEIRG
jgi:lactoylglutathione lyase